MPIILLAFPLSAAALRVLCGLLALLLALTALFALLLITLCRLGLLLRLWHVHRRGIAARTAGLLLILLLLALLIPTMFPCFAALLRICGLAARGRLVVETKLVQQGKACI
ncbi:MAG: hypothetical protein Alpg2KO_25630 [Alphaproteobacteria bacterium]